MSGDVDRYAPVPSAVYKLDDRHALVSVTARDRPLRLDLSLARVLEACHGCRTLPEHAASAAEVMGSVDRPSVQQAIGTLALSGLLTRLNPAAREEDVVPAGGAITTVGVVTADRPGMLERCVRTCIYQRDRHGWGCRFVVVDGSRCPEHRLANERVLGDLAKMTDAGIRYISAAEARHWRTVLRREMDASCVSAVTPGDVGANRNLLTLATAGERLLTLDDDVICSGWARATSANELVLAGHQDLRDTRVFATRAEAIAFARASAPVDVLGAHARVIGRRLDLLCAGASAVDSRQACRHLTSAIQLDRTLRVRLSFSGLAGDAGVHCQHGLLFSSGAARRRLSAEPRLLETALASREVARTVDRTVITHDPACMLYCAGLANDELLPPFMRSGRNEDGVFGAMVSFVDGAAVSVHLPHGVIHDSSRDSAYPADDIPSASHTRVCDVLLAGVAEAARSAVGRNARARVGRLAMVLRDLGELAPGEFVDWFRHVTLARAARSMERARQLAASGPDGWNTALDRWEARFLASADRPDFFLPLEFQRAASAAEGYDQVRAFLVEHARLISAWPELWSAARDYNQADEPLRAAR